MFTVRQKLSDMNYEIASDDGKTLVVHFNQLKKVAIRPGSEDEDPEPLRRSTRTRNMPAELRGCDLSTGQRSVE